MVAQIEQLNDAVLIRSQLITFEIELDLTRRILEMRERGLPVRPQRHQSPSEGIPRLVILAAVRRQRCLRRRAAIEAIGERRDATLDELLQLLAARGLDKSGHYAALFPKRFRNASMNGSRSPSMTLCTSLTFSSVRWSFTIVYGWKTYDRI